MRRTVFIFLLFAFRALGQNSMPSIGYWREHLPYQNAIDVTHSEQKVYCATPYSLFSVDLATGETERMSKVAGLSETGISTINFDNTAKKLYIAYANSNIDIIDAAGIHNLPDLKRENISGDKTIYQVYPDNRLCYLSTGLGIIVLDAEKLEVRDSWLIGSSGGYVKTYGFTKSSQFLYAATEEGLKKAAVNGPDPADFHNWQNLSGNHGLPATAAKAVVSLQQKILVLQSDSIFAENGNSFDLFYANNWPIVSIRASNNQLLVCQRKPNGASQVLILNSDGSLNRTLQQPGVISFPKNAISINNEYWVADLFGGLSRCYGSQFDVYKPDSPLDIATGGLAIYNDKFYAAAGSVNDAWNYQYNRNGIYQFANGSWSGYNQFRFPVLDSLMDFITVAADPRDGTIWAGSYGGGLLHIDEQDQLHIYKQSSPIGATVGDPTSFRVSGLAFDQDQNLWISNFGSAHQIHVLKNDGSWNSFTVPFYLNDNAVTQIIIDDLGQKWIASPLGNGLIVFDDNHTIDNTADDRWRLYRTGIGQGNLPSNEVMSLAKDKSGFIWVGTENGIGVIQCPQETFTGVCETVLPVIDEGGFANYLFSGQQVRSIAVDGADRKWVATASGVWLMSPDGDKVVMHFTEENSALLSNDVKSIAISGKTGEVFFATAKGICSFRSTATEASETKINVLVFPNPVTPDYRGTIGIRGLPENSVVKITETSGRLVFQTRSLGGQAVWNGKDYRGNPAASGIYLVLAEDENKQEKVVAKIVMLAAGR